MTDFAIGLVAGLGVVLVTIAVAAFVLVPIAISIGICGTKWWEKKVSPHLPDGAEDRIAGGGRLIATPLNWLFDTLGAYAHRVENFVEAKCPYTGEES